MLPLTGCPIRISADQGIFAPPRSFSQLVTSFVASESQGIPRTLLLDFLVLEFQIVKSISSASPQAGEKWFFVTFDSWFDCIIADTSCFLLYVSCSNMSKISSSAAA